MPPGIRIATSPFRKDILLRHLVSNLPDADTGKANPVYSDFAVPAFVEPATGDVIRQFTDQILDGRVVQVSIDHSPDFAVGTKDLLVIGGLTYRIVAVRDEMFAEYTDLLAMVETPA